MENGADRELTGRLMSLDALRGFDMLFIMGFAEVVVALCALAGARDGWLASQMSHVSWEGFHHHDTIFPLFLFLAGVSWPFSLAGQRAKGKTMGAIVRKILLRAVTLVFLGLAAGRLFTFDVASYRYDSVLAHIGICWAGAALLALFVKGWGARLAISLTALIGYWLLVWLVPAPDTAAVLASTDPKVMAKVAQYASCGTGCFSPVGSLACWADRLLTPGVRNELLFNADGTMAKLTGFALASFGVLAGELLRSRRFSGNEKTLILFGVGFVSLVGMLVWQPYCPVVKKIWTPTFVLAASAYSLFLLAAFHWIVDVRGWCRWTFFFRVIGLNAITIYLLMRVVGFSDVGKFFLCGIADLGESDWSQFVIQSGRVLSAWLVLWFLYRKGTFLKV